MSTKLIKRQHKNQINLDTTFLLYAQLLCNGIQKPNKNLIKNSVNIAVKPDQHHNILALQGGDMKNTRIDLLNE